MQYTTGMLELPSDLLIQPVVNVTIKANMSVNTFFIIFLNLILKN